MTADEYREQLREGICTVNFTKKNGEERIMHCTLRMGLIPEDKHPKGEKPTEADPHRDDVAKCFDVDKQAWRSFRVDTVNEFHRGVA